MQKAINEKNKILFIQRSQYGYLTDTLKIAEQLAKDMEVIVLCFDAGMDKFQSSGVDVRYVNGRDSFFLRAIRFIRNSISLARKNKDASVFVVYYPLCSLIAMFGMRDAILDFRTASVNQSSLIRTIQDFLSYVESLFYRRVTLISEGLRRRLCISEKKSLILPLGSDEISVVTKIFDWPRLLYIGTLSNRRIEQTIEGLYLFLKKRPEYVASISYDIIGDGPGNEVNHLRDLVRKLGVDRNVNIRGRLDHARAKIYFDTCNIGVSYVPMTNYYDFQPPTKTFEYVRSGIPVIATATTENARLISRDNGVLCEDNSKSFSEALELCINQFDQFQDSLIRNSLAKYSWKNIAREFKEFLLAE